MRNLTFECKIAFWAVLLGIELAATSPVLGKIKTLLRINSSECFSCCGLFRSERETAGFDDFPGSRGQAYDELKNKFGVANKADPSCKTCFKYIRD